MTLEEIQKRQKLKNYDKENKRKNEDEDEGFNKLTSCGIGNWRPKWLQPFASPVYFMWVMGLVGIIQGKNIVNF